MPRRWWMLALLAAVTLPVAAVVAGGGERAPEVYAVSSLVTVREPGTARSDAAAWVEVFVPRDAPAGTWRGEVRVSDGARPLGRVPVELTVHPFALPATSSIPVTYGFALRTALLGHAGPGQAPSPA